MTVGRSSDKRRQIIRAALWQYRQRSVAGTTLKDVAEAAQIPLGNLYYYVKTREELILAVLDECEQDLQALLSSLAPLEPYAWLRAYFDWLLQDPQASTQLGCPFGSLATELRAMGDPAAPRAAEIVQVYREAVALRSQQTSGSDPDTIFMAVQGAYTVAKILNDPTLYARSIEALWTHLLSASAQ